MPKKKLIKFQWCPASWGLSGQSYDEAEANYYLEGEELDRRLIEIRYKKNDPVIFKSKSLDLDVGHGKITRYERDCEMAKFENQDGGPDLDIAMLKVDLKHKKISPYDHDKTMQELCPANAADDQSIALLDIELKHGKITQKQYNKAVANVRCLPWADIIDSNFDPKDGVNGLKIEIDWNTFFLANLREHGYTGDDHDVVEAWFSEVCNGDRAGYDGPMSDIFNSQVAFRTMR